MKILVVDDEVTNLGLLDEYLEEDGYQAIKALNGYEGFTCLKDHPNISLILLDRTMPIMDGLEFIKKLKADNDYTNIPVVMQTAVADNDSIVECINAGAYYYLTKPYKKNVLISIVKAAIHDSRYKKKIVEETRKNRKMLGLLNSALFEIRTIEEAQNLACFIAGSFPDPEKVAIGLSEIMVNAVEHGNLGISYKEKGELMTQGNLYAEILRRASMPENINKRVQVFFEKNTREAKITIIDEGQGFNWNEFLEMHPDRATAPNGRGIIMARMMSFDNIEYKGTGNEVCCSVKISKETSSS